MRGSTPTHLLRILIFQHLLLQATCQFRQRYFKFEQAGSCPSASTDIAVIEKFMINQSVKFQYYLDADIKILKNITLPIVLRIQSVRCALEANSKCIHSDGLNIENTCDYINAENALWTPLMKSFQPKLTCPVQMGTYKIRNGTVDFSIISRLPLDGFRYNLNFKFFEKAKVKQIEILCLDFVFTVSFASNTRPSRNRGKPFLK